MKQMKSVKAEKSRDRIIKFFCEKPQNEPKKIPKISKFGLSFFKILEFLTYGNLIFIDFQSTGVE